MTEEFLSKEEHFNELLKRVRPDVNHLYHSMRHTRAETCYRGRSLIVYRIEDRQPHVIDEIEVLDFMLNEEDGGSTELRSKVTGHTMTVAYSPTKLFNHDVILFLPLYSRARWCTLPANVGGKGSLAFDMVLRTQSRRHLRERGVTYCETGPAWAAEFEGDAAVVSE